MVRSGMPMTSLTPSAVSLTATSTMDCIAPRMDASRTRRFQAQSEHSTSRRGRGVPRYADGRLETLIDVEGGQESPARAFVPFDILSTFGGDVWAADIHSLARFDGETWIQYEVNIRRLLEGPDGGVWGAGWDGRAGSDCCYIQFTGDNWVTYPHSTTLPVALELLGDLQRLKE